MIGAAPVAALLAALAAPPGSASAEAEAETIVLEVLNYEAKRSREWKICLKRQSSGVPFDWPKGNGGFGWITAPAQPPGAFTDEPKLPEDALAALNIAADRVVASPPPASPPVNLHQRQVPEGLRSQDPSCATLAFTVPAVSGDIAFVQTTFTCGSHCAEGWRYALRRESGRWSLFAVNFTWIS